MHWRNGFCYPLTGNIRGITIRGRKILPLYGFGFADMARHVPTIILYVFRTQCVASLLLVVVDADVEVGFEFFFGGVVHVMDVADDDAIL